MPVFTSDTEIYKYIGGIFERGLADPEVGPKLIGSGVVLEINYTDPDARITVDMPNSKVFTGDADGITPNVQLFMSADMGNKFWLGKVNLSVALAKGQVRAKGPVPKILKLIPSAKELFPAYKEMLEAENRNDLLNV
ncbi:sterol carrier protein [Saccharopolyspora sp. NPDC049426]|uniref:sterol carrier protein n=1 Tax=Saccharopolyspora sp. NPDC049426 TaxID=3155652 RepID=UPI0034334F2D